MAIYRTKNNTPGYNDKLGMAPGAENSWTKASISNVLSAISQDLPPVVDGTKINMDDISIPSPWAKFVSFEAVLFGGELEYGDLYKQAVIDWRCLLTLVALKDVIGINLNCTQGGQWSGFVDLNLPINIFEERFFNNLKLLRPDNFIFNEISCWDKVTPISICNAFKELNIGMFSNSTLVCPPYSYSAEAQNALGEKPFFRNGKFIDPINYIKSDPRRKFAMYHWLEELKKFINNNYRDCIAVDKISSLLVAFRDEIGMPAEEMDNIKVTAPAFYQASITDLFSNMKMSIQIIQEPCKLELVSDCNNKLIILDEVILGVSAISDTADAIVIINNKTLKQKGSFISGSRTFAGDQVPENIEIYNAQDLLLEKLILIDSGSTITNEEADKGIYNIIGKDVLWPINSILFKYLSACEIKNNTRIEKAGANEFVVTLKLKLLGGSFEVKKIYPQDNVVTISEYSMPHISIWPYARVTRDNNTENVWKKYFVYGAHYGSDHYPAVIQNKSNNPVNPYYLDRISVDDYRRETYIYDEIPTHIFMYDKENTTNYIGALLLAEPKTYKIFNSNKWSVGFDFGTTSTTAFYKDGNNNPTFIKLGTEFSLAKNPSTNMLEVKKDDPIDEGLFVALNPEHFPKDSQKYFVTDMYLKRNAYPSMYEQVHSQFEPAEAQAFIKGKSLFEYSDQSGNKIGNSTIYTDLKWSSDPSVRAAAKNYLYQLLLQITYAAVRNGIGKVEWKLSYPTALSQNLLEGYKVTTKSLISNLNYDSGVESACIDRFTYYTESIAAAEFFRTNARSGLFVCVDIGGGSTDVSIWKSGIKTENLLQTSINLASRLIFLPSIGNLICNDPNIGKAILQLNSKVEEKVAQNGGKFTTETRRYIEGVLFEHENAVHSTVSAYESIHKNKFQKSISIGFISLLYYAVDAVVSVKDNIQDEMSLAICLGGNGAKIYNWFPEFYKEEVATHLREYLKDTIGKDMTVEILYEKENLKTEAAKGLLNIVGNEKDFSRNTITLMGEKATVTYKDGSTEDISAEADIYNNETFKKYFEEKGKHDRLTNPTDISSIRISPDLENIKTFITMCNSIHKEFGETSMLLDYSKDDWVKIYEEIKAIQSDEIREGIMSPAFALGIKAILSKENKN